MIAVGEARFDNVSLACEKARMESNTKTMNKAICRKVYFVFISKLFFTGEHRLRIGVKANPIIVRDGWIILRKDLEEAALQ